MLDQIALTIKPTLACNMHCRHCFNGEKMKDATMLPVETAIKLMELAADEYRHVKITFHGGEPSTAGYSFYDQFFRCQKEIEKIKGTVFSNYFTTNGLLLDWKFIELLNSRDTMINISFDGPDNDVLRFSTDAVYHNIMLAQKMKSKMRIFCTLSSQSIHSLTNTYKWFNERNLDFKIAPIEPWGDANKYPNLLINPDEYLNCLMDTYQYWTKDTACRIHFNTFEEFIHFNPKMQFKPFWFHREIALNPDGQLYPFGRPNDIHYCLGTPYSLCKLSDSFESESYRTLMEKLKNCRERRCKKCRSLNICNGVIENTTYMYVDDENIVDARCYIGNEIFQRALAINAEIADDIACGNTAQYNPVVVKYITDA